MTLTACGGGDSNNTSSSSSSSSTSSLTYSGSSSQATVDSSNGSTISTSAYQSGNTAAGTGSAGGYVTAPSSGGARPAHLAISAVIEEAFSQVDFSTAGPPSAAAAVTIDRTVNGKCETDPGSATLSISYNIDGTFSGTITFNDFCASGVTATGSGSFTGSIDLTDLSIKTLSLTLSSVSFSQGSSSFTVDATASYDYTATPTTATISSMVLRDNATGKVYKVENLVLTINDAGSYMEINITSGRFYHPDYGYVDIATTEAIRINDSDTWPSAGVIVVTGSGGSKARLTFVSSTQYRVEVDADGDGTYEYDSGVQTW